MTSLAYASLSTEETVEFLRYIEMFTPPPDSEEVEEDGL